MFIRILFAAIIAATLFTACQQNQAAPGAGAAALPEMPVLAIQKQTATTANSYPASLQGMADVEIRPQVNGRLEKIWVDEGDYVHQGQPLFTIDESIYREELSNAQAGLQAAVAAVDNAQLEVDRVEPLVQNNVVSDFQLKSARAALELAKAKEAQAQAQVAAARINLGYTTIKAPVSGYIGRLPKKQGSLVGVADPEALTLLSDVHEIYAYFSLSEREFVTFKSRFAGGTLDEKLKHLPAVALILPDGSEHPQKGHIDMIDGQFDKNTAAITVRATFPNVQGLLRSGNTGKVSLSLLHDDAIVVPQSATVEIQDKIFVYALDSANRVARQPIEVSGHSGNNYLVSKGVQPGDRIVLKGFETLQDGAQIKPVEADPVIAKN